MKFGRVRFWVCGKQSLLNRKWSGQESIFIVQQRPEDVIWGDRVVRQYTNRKHLKNEMRKDAWKDFSCGVITYHIWRFCLSIRTPKYHIQQKCMW